MNCHAYANLADLHAEGRLSPRRAAAAAAHLASCAKCRDAHPERPAPSGARAPSAFKAGLAAALKSAPAPSPAARTLSPWPTEARGIAVAALALALAGLWAAYAGAPSQSGADAVAAVEDL